MLKLNCLINDTSIANDIKDAIEILVGERLEAGKGVSFPAVYRELRKQGLEVDKESAGFLYNELYQGYSDPMLSNEEQIAVYAGKDVVDQQKQMVDKLINGAGSEQQQIGGLKPEMQIAKMIASMFTDKTFGATKKVKSVMKEMETLVARAAKSLLPQADQKKVTNITEALDKFFKTEANKFQTLSGGVNTLKDLHSAVKDEVRNYLDNATDQLSDEEAQDLIDQWEAYTENFIQSTYDIMLSRSEDTKLLNTALQQVQIDGVNVADINGNIKWTSLMEDGDPTKIVDGVKKLFQEGVKDAQGNVHKYTAEQAERIGSYFQQLYDKKLASVRQAKVANSRSKNVSAKNIISDFIKDRGFINLVKDKDGRLLLTQANWDAALRNMIRGVGNQDGLEPAIKELHKFLNGVTTKDGNKLTDAQKKAIEQEFRKSVAARLMPATGTPGALERLAALQNLNRGRAFQESTAYALNKLLGVTGLQQSTIDKIGQMTQLFQNIIAPNNVTGSTSSNPTVNRGAYAFQALSQVERKIKEIIHSYKISADKKQLQRITKYLGDFMNAASTSLLFNPGNFGENILTGLATNIGETATMAATNYKLLKQFGKNQEAFLAGFASHFTGGAANEVVQKDDVPVTELPTGERLRLRALGDELKSGDPAKIAGAILKLPSYTSSVVARTFMNSFDAGFNAAVLRKQVVQSMYRALTNEGLSGDEALAEMGKALNIDDKTAKELKQENDRIMGLLRSAGLHPTAADAKLNLLDMRLSLYADALNSGVKAAKKNMSAKQIGEATKAMIEGSQQATKVLLGKKPIPNNWIDFINKFIYTIAWTPLAVQRELYKSQTSAEQQGNLATGATAQLGADTWKNGFARFVGGIANFAALATTFSPTGALTATSLAVERASLKKRNPGVKSITTADPGAYRKYAELNNLIRSTLVRSAAGTATITSFVMAKMLGEDDDDDFSYISNLMQTKSGRRLILKYLPMAIAISAYALYDVKDKKLDTRWERLTEVASNITGTTYDSWSNVKSKIGRAKDSGDVGSAIATGLAGSVPTFNINQKEQITKFIDTIRSAMDEENISDVKRDEKISNAIYHSAEDWVDVLMVNGAIDAIRRSIKEGEVLPNRFKKEE